MSTLMKAATLFLLLLIISWATVADEPLDVSMVQLISTPEQFQNKTVRLIGFLRVEFEGNGLYLHREDYEQSIPKNGVWIDIPPELKSRAKDLSLGYVLIVGIFDETNKGHKGRWSGSLSKISRIEKWGATK